MDNIQFCYIIEQYYIDHPNLIKILDVDDATIEKEVIDYINSYTRVANKGRVNLNARFRESSLINFHNELEITYKGQIKVLPSSKK